MVSIERFLSRIIRITSLRIYDNHTLHGTGKEFSVSGYLI